MPTIQQKAEILADLWLNYRHDDEFTDFIEYNDLGLPLAYAVSSKIVELTDKAEGFIDETYALLLSGLDIEDDPEVETLDELLGLDADK